MTLTGLEQHPVTLSQFIDTERSRFDDFHNNTFAFAFAKVDRYVGFLKIIAARYMKSDVSFHVLMERHKSLFPPGNYPMNSDQLQWHEENARLIALIHLDIESFYMFAKITLDLTATAFQYYFGNAKGLPLFSHNDLHKNVTQYLKQKQLPALPKSLAEKIDQLMTTVRQYRDKDIVHEKGVRTMFGLTYQLNTPGSSKRFKNVVYPRDKDLASQSESKPLGELMSDINSYIEALVGYIIANHDKTALTLKSVPDSTPKASTHPTFPKT